MGTKVSAVLNPRDPVPGTAVGTRNGIYQAYDLVQGHLLNVDMGGRAINPNLFPLTRRANMNHGGIEGEVKHMYRRLDDGDTIYYEVKGEMTKTHFKDREDFIKNSRILCTIGISNANYYELLVSELPVSNNTEYHVSWAERNEERENVPWPDYSAGDTRIVYMNPVNIKFHSFNRLCYDVVSGGVEAHLSLFFPVRGTGVGSKSGIYRLYHLVQGHMLNADLGGRAIAQNLFPVSKELNRHHAGVEAQVKRLYTDFLESCEKDGNTSYNGTYIYYCVKPYLNKEEFISAEDFLQNTSIFCCFGMSNGEKKSIKLTNPVNLPGWQIPGIIGREFGGRGIMDNRL